MTYFHQLVASFRQEMLHHPQVQTAIDDVSRLIVSRYPEATFHAFVGDEPFGVYLRATIENDDTDAFFDVIADRLLDIQIDEGLPFYVFPVPSEDRNEAPTELDHPRRTTETAHLAATGD